ncbi:MULTISPECIES: hypothetical protein [unclassified Thiocapsa]|uniref:hypothetical protein n=1 Tax=unclassified Thiocapsa TaxID=2641286 RepID=UPI0035B2999B
MKRPFTAVLTLGLLLMSNAGALGADPVDDPAFDRHRFAKHYMYGTLTRQSAADVFKGTEQPLLKFEVLDDPPSLFVNFEISPDKVDDLVEFLALPPGFALTPIAILEGETPRLYLSLNIYAVYGLRGLLSGNRAEWSVYVTKNGGRPSYMVVDARASELTLDSVNWFTPGTELIHGKTNDGLSSVVVADEGTSFRSLVTQAGILNAGRVYPEPSWVSANDRIYWRDGVADRTYYDGDFVDTPILSVDPDDMTMLDDTLWRQFVIPRPVSVLVYETGFELVISPWYNLDPE